MSAASIHRRPLAILAALAASVALAAAAQSTERPKPPGTVPLEEVPPPPPMITSQPEFEPEVTVRTQGEEKIQEYRHHGKLYMMRVTPKGGHPYILMDLKGDGTFTRQENALDSGVRVPQWVLMEF
jgi:hemin uptake protein HemP